MASLIRAPFSTVACRIWKVIPGSRTWAETEYRFGWVLACSLDFQNKSPLVHSMWQFLNSYLLKEEVNYDSEVLPHVVNAFSSVATSLAWQCTLHLANGISNPTIICWAKGPANTSPVCSATGQDVMLVVCIKKQISHALCLCVSLAVISKQLLPLDYHSHTQWTRQTYLISSGAWFTQTQWTHQLLPCWLVSVPLGGGWERDHDKWRVTTATMTVIRQVCICVCSSQ